jgi:hypothetical protein
MLLLGGLVVAFIFLMNWLPLQIQQNTASQYNSIDAARTATDVDNIMVPVYIPEGISWPPSLIVAQKKPFYALVMEFRNVKTREIEMFIIQSSSEGAEKRFQKMDFVEVKEEAEYILKGRNALLIVGDCKGGIECSKLVWRDGGIYCSVFLMSSSFNLIKVAESMIR